MFNDPWNLIGNYVIGRFLVRVLAAVYGILFVAGGVFLPDPLQTYWVWAGLGLPVVALVVGVPAFIVWSICTSIRDARIGRESDLRRGVDPVLGYGPIRTPKGKRLAAAYVAAGNRIEPRVY